MHISDHFSLQYYVTKALPIEYKKQMCRRRMSSHYLPIEHSIHTNNRNCKLYHSDTEDEFHSVLRRKKAEVFKYIRLLSAKNFKELCNLCCYLQHAFERREL